MGEIRPYTIHHVYINDLNQNEYRSLEQGGRYYLVFWWKSFALGDLYIENYNDQFEDLQRDIFNAIEPALQSYLADGCLVGQIKTFFFEKSLKEFMNLMEESLKQFLPESYPDTLGISVIICTRNRSSDLDVCLHYLLKQHCLPSEIIVIDNAPSDSGTKNVVNKYDSVSYILEPKAGLDFARNTGVKSSRFPIIAFVDDDVKVHPLWSYRIWETFQDTDIAAMTGLIISFSLETESQQIFEKHWGFNKGYKEISFNKAFIQVKPPRVWDIGAGANMAFRKVVIEQADYFDERLGAGASGCGDDSEMWYKILLNGHIIKYNPRAISFHEHRKDMESLHKQLFSYMRGHVAASLLQHKYYPKAGYKKYVFYDIPRYYLLLARIGFPNYHFRYSTLWSEFKGISSGFRFYLKNRKRPRISKP